MLTFPWRCLSLRGYCSALIWWQEVKLTGGLLWLCSKFLSFTSESRCSEDVQPGPQTMARLLQNLPAAQVLPVPPVPEVPPAVLRWAGSCADPVRSPWRLNPQCLLWLPCLAGWQSASIHSSRLSLPDCRVSSVGLGRIQHYSTSGDSKNDPPKAQSAEAPSTDKLSSGDLKATPSSAGTPQVPDVTEN